MISPVLPAAVLWDMDGTLVDSEPYWIAEEFALVESFGGQWSMEHAHHLVGSALLTGAAYIIEKSPVTLTPEEVVARLVGGVAQRLRAEVPWRPGGHELLQQVREAGIPCALVTMSYRELADILVESMGDDLVQVIVTGEDVSDGKPHPEPYLRAAELLGVDPGDCIAIEDSRTGALSSTAAGVPTVVIPHVVAVPQVPGAVHHDTLEGLTPADLMALTAPLRGELQSSAGIARPTT